MAKLQYIATITGDSPPFRWEVSEVKATQPSGTKRKVAGEADSYADALIEAREAALGWEAARIHKLTVHREVVLEVDEKVEPVDVADLLTRGQR